ncbi:MAG: hemerythrin family protein [Firmicutes bacterium]|nr:hemerythrin family protein [Bacillota bacterium]
MAEWTQDLAVGVPKIDAQHQELYRQVNKLIDACNEGKGKEAVGEVISFLQDYVVQHFQCEEEYMQKYDYPEFAKHKAAHDAFVKSFLDLKARFEQEGPGIHIVVLTNRTVVDWLNSHISKTDKALGAFLKTKL